MEKAAAIQKIARQLQKECHALVEVIRSYRTGDPGQLAISYQDAANTWLFLKLAEFELRLRKIEK